MDLIEGLTTRLMYSVACVSVYVCCTGAGSNSEMNVVFAPTPTEFANAELDIHDGPGSDMVTLVDIRLHHKTSA